MKIRELFPTVLGLLVLAGAPCALAGERIADTVRGFIDAGNDRDVEAMLAVTAEDIRWKSVDGDRVVVELEGREALGQWLEGYFLSSMRPVSEIGEVLVDGRYATTVETVRWSEPDGGTAAQSAISVYEFDDAGRIRAVWYFPEHKHPPQ